MTTRVNQYTVNAVGKDGYSYALYFYCKDMVEAENIIKQTGIIPDAAGVCEMVTGIPFYHGKHDG